MKKALLITSVLISGTTLAQFTQANEPAVGENQTMYVCDPTAPDYASMTGTGQNWDYSVVPGDGTTSALSIEDPATTPEGASFTGATKAVVIDNFMTTYLSSSAASRNSEGFSFEAGGAFGTVNAVLDTDDEILMSYPFAVGSSVSDDFSGTAESASGDFPCTGNAVATVDGSGTLILNGTTTLTGVVRYKLVDTATATGIPIFNTAQIIRTQYEYYDLANSELPVFIHATLTISIAGGAPTAQTVVLNSVEPNDFLAADQQELSGLTVYPNPAADVIAVKGLKDNATLTLIDAQGKTVAATAVEPGVASLAIDTVEAGVYFLHIATANGSRIERVVVK